MSIERIIILFLGIVIIGYLIFMSKLRKSAAAYDDFDYDPRFASYTPTIKQGEYKVRLDETVSDLEDINRIMVRYERLPLNDAQKGDVILDAVSLYTAEDFVEDLDYIDVQAVIEKGEISIS